MLMLEEVPVVEILSEEKQEDIVLANTPLPQVSRNIRVLSSFYNIIYH